jgi:hypothetical protein
LSEEVARMCDGKPACEIDTAAWFAKTDNTPDCTEEIAVRFSCTPHADVKQVFLYEGQRGNLACKQDD